MNILVTGLTGLIGLRIQQVLSTQYTFENLSRSEGVDISDKEAVLKKIASSKASYVIHLAGKTNVDECEKEKDSKEKGSAWDINVEGTRNIMTACEETGKKLIYFSTDLVFDGTQEMYSEEDRPSPINFYGRTKYEGEKIITSCSTPWLIVRPSYPYTFTGDKKDFVRAILSRLQHNEAITAVTDQIITPTLIDDIAYSLDALIKTQSTGIFHVNGSDSHSPFVIAQKIAEVFEIDSSLILPITRKEFFSGRAERPYKLVMKNDKITKLGVKMKSLREGLLEIKEKLI